MNPTPNLKNIKLISLDIDGTIFKNNSWEILNKHLRVSQSDDYALYNAGGLTYEEWVEKLYALYTNDGKRIVTKEGVEDSFRGLELRKGIEGFVSHARETNIEVVLTSGTFSTCAQYVADELRIESYYAHTTFEYDGSGNLINMSAHGKGDMGKAQFLENIIKEKELEKSEVMHVGDTDEDLLSFGLAGIRVGIDGKNLEEKTDYIISDFKQLTKLFRRA